jgi:hypothetical protein
MITRKSVNTMTDTEKATLVRALLELKRHGEYDKYVHWHADAIRRRVRTPFWAD